MKRLAVFVSGTGNLLAALIAATTDGTINGTIELVVSSRPDAFGLVRACQANIPTMVAALADFDSAVSRDKAILAKLKSHQIDLVILAGYLGIVTAQMIAEFPGKIINIHPALLPAYGGKGMHGLNVHRQVWLNRERSSGATVHLVSEGIDTGQIIAQRSMPLDPTWTPEQIQQQILQNIETKLLVEVVADLCK